jgi:hypothetical protein
MTHPIVEEGEEEVLMRWSWVNNWFFPSPGPVFIPTPRATPFLPPPFILPCMVSSPSFFHSLLCSLSFSCMVYPPPPPPTSFPTLFSFMILPFHHAPVCYNEQLTPLFPSRICINTHQIWLVLQSASRLFHGDTSLFFNTLLISLLG